jgi:hypothetical protein
MTPLKLVDEAPRGWQESVLAQIDANDGDPTSLGPAKVTVTRSKSDDMKFYYIIDFGWIVVCTCRGYRFRSDCSHTREYLDGP